MTILGRKWSTETIAAILIAVMSLVYTVYSANAQDTRDLAVKLRGIEVQQENDRPRLERIENKIDWLIMHSTEKPPQP